VSRNLNPEEISAILQAAGLIEQSRDKLKYVPDQEYQNYREHLKTLADRLAGDAVSQKVRIANDVMQHYGRES
jgi:hypothetical protein